jgi:hypothetical protein
LEFKDGLSDINCICVAEHCLDDVVICLQKLDCSRILLGKTLDLPQTATNGSVEFTGKDLLVCNGLIERELHAFLDA